VPCPSSLFGYRDFPQSLFRLKLKPSFQHPHHPTQQQHRWPFHRKENTTVQPPTLLSIITMTGVRVLLPTTKAVICVAPQRISAARANCLQALWRLRPFLSRSKVFTYLLLPEVSIFCKPVQIWQQFGVHLNIIITISAMVCGLFPRLIRRQQLSIVYTCFIKTIFNYAFIFNFVTTFRNHPTQYFCGIVTNSDCMQRILHQVSMADYLRSCLGLCLSNLFLNGVCFYFYCNDVSIRISSSHRVRKFEKFSCMCLTFHRQSAGMFVSEPNCLISASRSFAAEVIAAWLRLLWPDRVGN